MAYPFLLNIPLPSLSRSPTETPATPNQERAPSANSSDNAKIYIKAESEIRHSNSSAIKEEQREETRLPSTSESASLPGPTAEDTALAAESNYGLTLRNGRPAISTPPLERPNTSAEPRHNDRDSKRVVIDLTVDDEVALEVERHGSTRTTYLGDSIANPIIIKNEPDSTPVPTPPASSRGRSQTPQSIKQDDKESDHGAKSLAADQSTPRGIKRPSDHATGAEDTGVNQPPSKKRGRAKKAPPPPLYKATAERAGGTSDIPAAMDFDDSVLAKIKKCFDRAGHENASETEARAALHLATKLMSRYNVERAEVMQYKTAEEQAQAAGESRVLIRRSDDKEQVIPIRQWVTDLASAMGIFFDVKTYSSTTLLRCPVIWVFYGAAQNTASAALAFEKIYNLIMDWARFKKGIATRNSYCLGVAEKLRSDAKKEKDDEMAAAKRAEAEELARREKEEQLHKQKELERLQPIIEDEPETEPELIHEPAENPNSGAIPCLFSEESPSERKQADILDLGDTYSPESEDSDNDDPMTAPYHDDDESDEDDDQPDVVLDEQQTEEQQFDNIDDEIEFLKQKTFGRESAAASPTSRQHPLPSTSHKSPTLRPPEPTTPPREEPPEPEPRWKSSMQLTVFRETYSRIADDYLRSKNLKLKTSRRGAAPKDMKAFHQGNKDGRKIDVRQKALEDKEDEKVL